MPLDPQQPIAVARGVARGAATGSPGVSGTHGQLPPGTGPSTAPSRGEFPSPFGRYLLLKRLSRGGMGEIFLAKVGEIIGFEKFVIIKKILPQLAANDDFIVRFIDEAQIAIKLSHVNIAQVAEVGRVDGEYFLAIEYIEGRDLRRLLRRCREIGYRLPVDLCLYIAREVAAGLAYAHRRTGPKGQALSLVHCDISPPNVMVSYEGEVKVIDFGIARSALRTADSNPNIGFGKFGYMAPEQLIRGGLIDRRTDIYAAGVVLYELLTGERLYTFPDGTDYRQMARIVCQGQFVPPSQKEPRAGLDGGHDLRGDTRGDYRGEYRIDREIDAVVCKALATRPDDRYQNAEEFRDALQAKLSQLNPTISGDRLASVVDDLFAVERQRESEELMQMRAVDSTVYREELQGAAGHTVTFARAPDLGAIGPGSREEATQVGGLGDDAKTVLGLDAHGDLPTPTALTGLPIRRRGWLVPVGVAGLLLLLVGSGGVYYFRHARLAPRPLTEAERSQLAQPEPGPMVPPPAPPVPPVVEALPQRPEAPSEAPSEDKAPRRRPIRARAEVEAEVAEKRRIEVDRKFKEVRAEYVGFKQQFGARLEDRWQGILSDIALGRRDQSVSDALDALRRDMRKVRSERKPEPPAAPAPGE
ncbi:MAG: serine/threonine-protein kinase [Polyangia bacterium]